MATGTSYWCYRCNRFVRVWPQDSIICPDCEGGFLEEVETPSPASSAADREPRLRPYPTPPMYLLNNDNERPHHPSDIRFRRRRNAGAGDRSPFNPVIVLRGHSDGGGVTGAAVDQALTSSYEFFYVDGSGSVLRPLPDSMSEFLMGSGFERLLDQLSQIEISGVGSGRSCDFPPASKSAIESMPTIEIAACHVSTDSHCAVCKDPFEIGSEAREMPCKHIYHPDCILPWLSLRNSCPVCRHEMPADVRSDGGDEGDEEEAVGLTIWRLPGGGFAVGRFSGGRREGERELPMVYTEMDGGFNSGGAPMRRISWTSRGSRSRQSGGGGGGGIGRVFRNFLSFFGRQRFRRSSSSSSSSSSSRLSSESEMSNSLQRDRRGGSLLRIHRGGGGIRR